MTHEIYIAVIVVLAGVVGWLWRRCSCFEGVAVDCSLEISDLMDELEECRQRAAQLSDRIFAVKRDRAEMLLEGTALREDCEYLQASNRSLRGWNGRYRRRIAALEAELADERGEA